MTHFDRQEVPLVVGKITGIRSWTIGEDGALYPLSVNTESPWTDGVNDAVCALPTFAFGIGYSVSGAYQRMIDCWSAEHHPGKRHCTCGFYAYNSAMSNEVMGSNTHHVTGIVRGWGTVSVGDKGFRAQHAEIVALIAPPFWRPNRRAGFFNNFVMTFIMLTVINAMRASVMSLLEASGWMKLVWGLVLVFFGALLFVDAAIFGLNLSGLMARRKYRKIKERYPSAEWFFSTRKALKKYPIVPMNHYAAFPAAEQLPDVPDVDQSKTDW